MRREQLFLEDLPTLEKPWTFCGVLYIRTLQTSGCCVDTKTQLEVLFKQFENVDDVFRLCLEHANLDQRISVGLKYHSDMQTKHSDKGWNKERRNEGLLGLGKNINMKQKRDITDSVILVIMSRPM